MSSTGDEDHEDPAQVLETQSAPTSEDEVKDALGHSEEEFSSDEEQRDGRFYGPDSSWRFYTREERALASSLDQAENNDLGGHLYNVHAWKQRLYNERPHPGLKPWFSKRRWTRVDDKRISPWHPHPRLTAWPLRPVDVPRRREEWGIPTIYPHEDPSAYAKPEAWKPSFDLQEELKATFLRQAKERFRRREWEINVSSSQQSRSAPAASSRQAFRSSIDEAEDNYSADELDLLGAQLQESNEEEPSASRSFVGRVFPNFIEDDEEASIVLQPTVRHILAKQDSLLAGLHHSRRGHAKYPRAQRRKSRSRSKSTSRAHSSGNAPLKRKRVSTNVADEGNTPEPGSGTNDEDSSDVDISAGEVRRPSYNRRQLGTRDWSEVLGMAAIVGWDQAIIDRASRRCATLFGENMMMRIMPETSAGNERDRVVTYAPEPIPELHMPSDVDVDVDSSEESVEPLGFPCPHDSCDRHDKPYEVRWRMRAHLKRKHKNTNEEIDALLKKKAYDEADHMLIHSVSDASEDQVMEGADDQQSEKEEVADAQVAFEVPPAVREDGFLHHVDVLIGRSRHKRPRIASSKSTSRNAAVSCGRRGHSKS